MRPDVAHGQRLMAEDRADRPGQGPSYFHCTVPTLSQRGRASEIRSLRPTQHPDLHATDVTETWNSSLYLIAKLGTDIVADQVLPSRRPKRAVTPTCWFVSLDFATFTTPTCSLTCNEAGDGVSPMAIGPIQCDRDRETSDRDRRTGARELIDCRMCAQGLVADGKRMCEVWMRPNSYGPARRNGRDGLTVHP